jgi:hypothetical protein
MNFIPSDSLSPFLTSSIDSALLPVLLIIFTFIMMASSYGKSGTPASLLHDPRLLELLAMEEQIKEKSAHIEDRLKGLGFTRQPRTQIRSNNASVASWQ